MIEPNLKNMEVVKDTESFRIVSISGNSSSRCDDTEITHPEMTYRTLRRYIEDALDRVFCGRADANANEIQKILNLVQESCIKAIKNDAFPSKMTNGDDEQNITQEIDIVEEKFLRVEKEDIVLDANTLKDGGAPPGETDMAHSASLRKDVPKFAVYCVRGVRCKLCWLSIKGCDCLQDLIDHTKLCHPEQSCPRSLKKIKKDNSYEKLLGEGIPYCTCATCIRVGIARWDKRFDGARQMTPKVRGRKYAFTGKNFFPKK